MNRSNTLKRFPLSKFRRGLSLAELLVAIAPRSFDVQLRRASRPDSYRRPGIAVGRKDAIPRSQLQRLRKRSH